MKLIPSAVLSISLVVFLAGAGTWAQYIDTEVSSGNSLTAGTMDLYMRDNGPVIDREWTLTNMVPGSPMSFKSGQLNLYNAGITEADHVEIEFSNVCLDPGYEARANEESDTFNGASGMDRYLRVDSMSYSSYSGGNSGSLIFNGISTNPSIRDSNNNGYIDLEDLNGLTLDNLAPPGPNMQDHIDFDMIVSFDKSAPNDYQGDECTLTLTFTLNQSPSQ